MLEDKVISILCCDLKRGDQLAYSWYLDKGYVHVLITHVSNSDISWYEFNENGNISHIVDFKYAPSMYFSTCVRMLIKAAQ